MYTNNCLYDIQGDSNKVHVIANDCIFSMEKNIKHHYLHALDYKEDSYNYVQ